jgi:hypothetical protein
MMMVLLRMVLAVMLLGLLLVVAAIIANRVPLTAAPGMALRLKTYLTTHHAATHGDATFPELRSREYARSAAEVYAAARASVIALGWVIISDDVAQGRLHAMVISRLWRFKDDVFVAVEATSAGARLNASAQSRVGRGDLGANLRHIMDLNATLDAHLINLHR